MSISSTSRGSGQVRATRTCAVASPHTEATRAGIRCVDQGGNAIDAALCAAVTLCVVYPHHTSIGGDLFALVHAPDGTITSVNASGPAARRVDAVAVRARHGGHMPVRGADTVTVPGAVAGLGRLHALGAGLPWGAHFATARELAETGVAVAPGLARAFGEEVDLLRTDPGLSAVFLPEGRPPGVGRTLVQAQLARTLGRIAEHGPAELYRGDLAREIVAGLRSFGSVQAEDDFAAFEPQVDRGVSRTFRGQEVWTAGPNSQGFLLLEILQALELAGCGDPLGTDAGLLSELCASASRDRESALADPVAMTETLDALLDAGRWSEIVSQLGRSAHTGSAHTGSTPGAPSPMPQGDTIAVVAADSDGWAVSLVQSLFHSFGAGLLHEPTGIIFHDRGALFSLDPGSPNVLAPGKRPAHTLMPVLVRENGKLRWVMGAMGGRAQPQIHAQLLLRLLGGAEPADAVGAPRWIVELAGDASDSGGAGDRGGQGDRGGRGVALVERGVPASARESIAACMPVLGLPELDETTGHAQVVSIEVDDARGVVLTAGSDPRADGSAVVVTVPADERSARAVVAPLASDGDGLEGR